MISYDIMEIDRKYALAVDWLQRMSIEETGKQAILEYDKARSLQGLSKTRRLRYIQCLGVLARDCCKGNFAKLTPEAIKDMVAKIDDNPAWTIRTRFTYRGILRQYCKWLEWGDRGFSKKGFPESCDWIRGHVRKLERRRVSPDEILTEEEVVRFIRAANNPFEQAWAAALYETGCRVSELGNRQVGDVQVEKGEVFLHIRSGRGSKTGARTVLLIASAPFLEDWLETHPWGDQPTAPLWPTLNGRSRGQPQKHPNLIKMTKKLAERAGIRKRMYHHLLRHTRATHLLANNWMTRSEVELMLGWVPGTDVIQTYVHLTQQAAFDATRRMYGLVQHEKPENPITPKICPSVLCRAANKFTALVCRECRNSLINRGNDGTRVPLVKAFEERVESDVKLKAHVDQLIAMLRTDKAPGRA